VFRTFVSVKKKSKLKELKDSLTVFPDAPFNNYLIIIINVNVYNVILYECLANLRRGGLVVSTLDYGS